MADHWLARLFGLQGAPAGTFTATPPVEASVPPARPGDVVTGRRAYRLVRQLGAGSYGSVFEAEDAGHPVAVKLLSPRLQHKTRLDTLRRELSSMLAVEHPNIPRVVDWQLDGDQPFVVMELFATSLEAQLARDGVLPDDQITPLFLALLGALSAARRACVLHLDIKPGNVLLRADGSYALGDFGTAQAALADAEITGRTSRGTRGYQAPEQARPDASAVDARTDLYGAGATLWAALTGIDLSSPRGLRILATHTGPAALPPAAQYRPLISPRVDRLLQSMLAREPQDRPVDPADVIGALQQLSFERPPERGERVSADEAARVRAALLDPLWAFLLAQGNPAIYRFAPGALLVDEGEASHHAFVLLQGQVCVLRDGLPLAVERREGAFLGEVAALTGERRMARMEAVDDVVVMRLDVMELERLVTQNPAVGVRLIHAMADRLGR